MSGRIPDGVTFLRAENGLEFERFLSEGHHAKLYFLDDNVEDSSGDEGPHFLKHAEHLLGQRPDARIFYHGHSPTTGVYKYCRERNIPIIRREVIGDVIGEELSE